MFSMVLGGGEHGMQGVILNPMTYCPRGSKVFVMPLNAFYTALRNYFTNYDYELVVLHVRSIEMSKLKFESLPFEASLSVLTDWNSLAKDDFNAVLEKKLKSKGFNDNNQLKDILEARMTPGQRDFFALSTIRYGTRHHKRSHSVNKRSPY